MDQSEGGHRLSQMQPLDIGYRSQLPFLLQVLCQLLLTSLSWGRRTRYGIVNFRVHH
jgi:hypothetical protein